MTHRTRNMPRRRTLLAAFATLLIGATTGSSPDPPEPHHRWYYSDASWTQLVGEAEWSCNLRYHQLWGTLSPYYEVMLLDCDGASGRDNLSIGN